MPFWRNFNRKPPKRIRIPGVGELGFSDDAGGLPHEEGRHIYFIAATAEIAMQRLSISAYIAGRRLTSDYSELPANSVRWIWSRQPFPRGFF